MAKSTVEDLHIEPALVQTTLLREAQKVEDKGHAFLGACLRAIADIEGTTAEDLGAIVHSVRSSVTNVVDMMSLNTELINEVTERLQDLTELTDENDRKSAASALRQVLDQLK